MLRGLLVSCYLTKVEKQTSTRWGGLEFRALSPTLEVGYVFLHCESIFPKDPGSPNRRSLDP